MDFLGDEVCVAAFVVKLCIHAVEAGDVPEIAGVIVQVGVSAALVDEVCPYHYLIVAVRGEPERIGHRLVAVHDDRLRRDHFSVGLASAFTVYPVYRQLVAQVVRREIHISKASACTVAAFTVYGARFHVSGCGNSKCDITVGIVLRRTVGKSFILAACRYRKQADQR